MRGRGQMCRLAWVSVEIIETVRRERSEHGGKTRHFHRKLMKKPTLAVELGKNEMLEARDLSSYISATKLRL